MKQHISHLRDTKKLDVKKLSYTAFGAAALVCNVASQTLSKPQVVKSIVNPTVKHSVLTSTIKTVKSDRAAHGLKIGEELAGDPHISHQKDSFSLLEQYSTLSPTEQLSLLAQLLQGLMIFIKIMGIAQYVGEIKQKSKESKNTAKNENQMRLPRARTREVYSGVDAMMWFKKNAELYFSEPEKRMYAVMDIISNSLEMLLSGYHLIRINAQKDTHEIVTRKDIIRTFSQITKVIQYTIQDIPSSTVTKIDSLIHSSFLDEFRAELTHISDDLMAGNGENAAQKTALLTIKITQKLKNTTHFTGDKGFVALLILSHFTQNHIFPVSVSLLQSFYRTISYKTEDTDSTPPTAGEFIDTLS